MVHIDFCIFYKNQAIAKSFKKIQRITVYIYVNLYVTTSSVSSFFAERF